MVMYIITVKVPVELVEKLDEVVRKRGYGSRSEAVRQAIRELVKRELEHRTSNENSRKDGWYVRLES